MTNQHVSKPSVSTKITQYHINWRYNSIIRIILIHLPRNKKHMTFMGHGAGWFQSPFRIGAPRLNYWTLQGMRGTELELFSSHWMSYHEKISTTLGIISTTWGKYSEMIYQLYQLRSIIMNSSFNAWTGARTRFSAWTVLRHGHPIIQTRKRLILSKQFQTYSRILFPIGSMVLVYMLT